MITITLPEWLAWMLVVLFTLYVMKDLLSLFYRFLDWKTRRFMK